MRIVPSNQVEEIIPSYPIIFIDDNHLGQQVFTPIRQITWNYQGFLRDIVEQFLLAESSPWQFSN